MLIKKHPDEEKLPPVTGGWTGRVVESIKILEKKRVRKPIKFGPAPKQSK
jgi:hypothetical protein